MTFYVVKFKDGVTGVYLSEGEAQLLLGIPVATTGEWTDNPPDPGKKCIWSNMAYKRKVMAEATKPAKKAGKPAKPAKKAGKPAVKKGGQPRIRSRKKR
jgi:hypothetical protein